MAMCVDLSPIKIFLMGHENYLMDVKAHVSCESTVIRYPLWDSLVFAGTPSPSIWFFFKENILLCTARCHLPPLAPSAIIYFFLTGEVWFAVHGTFVSMTWRSILQSRNNWFKYLLFKVFIRCWPIEKCHDSYGITGTVKRFRKIKIISNQMGSLFKMLQYYVDKLDDCIRCVHISSKTKLVCKNLIIAFKEIP